MGPVKRRYDITATSYVKPLEVLNHWRNDFGFSYMSQKNNERHRWVVSAPKSESPRQKDLQVTVALVVHDQEVSIVLSHLQRLNHEEFSHLLSEVMDSGPKENTGKVKRATTFLENVIFKAGVKIHVEEFPFILKKY